MEEGFWEREGGEEGWESEVEGEGREKRELWRVVEGRGWDSAPIPAGSQSARMHGAACSMAHEKRRGGLERLPAMI